MHVCTIDLINLQKDYGDSSFMKKLQDELKKQKFMLPLKSLLTRNSALLPNTPVLKLIIRASGLNSPRDDQYISTNNETHIPANVPEEYPQDIKKHGAGVVFHLPPEHSYPTLLSDVKPIREARKQHNLKAWPQMLEHLIKKGFFSFNLQTGFSNSNTPNPRTKNRGDNDTSGEKRQEKIEDITSLKQALLL